MQLQIAAAHELLDSARYHGHNGLAMNRLTLVSGDCDIAA